MDAFCDLLQKKLAYKQGERDAVLMKHIFGIKTKTGQQLEKTSTLVAYGTPAASAMALTVGIPAAISTQLILEGRVGLRGVLTPVAPEIYGPVLEGMREEGIQVTEETRVL